VKIFPSLQRILPYNLKNVFKMQNNVFIILENICKVWKYFLPHWEWYSTCQRIFSRCRIYTSKFFWVNYKLKSWWDRNHATSACLAFIVFFQGFETSLFQNLWSGCCLWPFQQSVSAYFNNESQFRPHDYYWVLCPQCGI